MRGSSAARPRIVFEATLVTEIYVDEGCGACASVVVTSAGTSKLGLPQLGSSSGTFEETGAFIRGVYCFHDTMAAVRNMRQRIVCVVLCMLVIGAETARVGEVIWAVNCGGEAHTDIHGVRYQRDTLATGTASDYGKKLTIQRTGPQDQTLYQTERYHTSTFGYDFPIKQDGEYALVLKFSEVWFTSPNMKVSLPTPTQPQPSPRHVRAVINLYKTKDILCSWSIQLLSNC